MFSFDTHTLHALKSGAVIYTFFPKPFFLNSLKAVPACLFFLLLVNTLSRTSSGATPILRGLHPQRHIKAAVTATSFRCIELRFVQKVEVAKIHTHWTGAKLWRHKVCRPRAPALFTCIRYTDEPELPPHHHLAEWKEIIRLEDGIQRMPMTDHFLQNTFCYTVHDACT